jgi:transcriptional regulator with XRE-family HTH domain
MPNVGRKPHRLGEKLLAIRRALKLSQNGILRQLELSDELSQAEWSAYERGVRIPSLPVVLLVAKLAGVWMDVLVDDELDLPGDLPAKPRSEGVKQAPISPHKRIATKGSTSRP